LRKSFINNVQRLNELLLNSLPHPALISNKDRIILAANKKAIEAGLEVGKYCWQEKRSLESIPDEDRKYFKKHGKPPPGGTQCSFCKADSAIEKRYEENDHEVIIGNSIFNKYWVHLEGDMFLHYSIDVTAEQKKLKNAKEQKKLLQNLADFQKEVSRLDSAKLVRKAFDFIKKQIGADFVGIMLLEDDQKRFRLFHTTAKKNRSEKSYSNSMTQSSPKLRKMEHLSTEKTFVKASGVSPRIKTYKKREYNQIS